MLPHLPILAIVGQPVGFCNCVKLLGVMWGFMLSWSHYTELRLPADLTSFSSFIEQYKTNVGQNQLCLHLFGLYAERCFFGFYQCINRLALCMILFSICCLVNVILLNAHTRYLLNNLIHFYEKKNFSAKWCKLYLSYCIQDPFMIDSCFSTNLFLKQRNYTCDPVLKQTYISPYAFNWCNGTLLF